MYKLSYKKLSKILKRIVKKYENNSVIFNIPYLHFVRGHPKFSFIYPEVFKNGQFSKRHDYNLLFKIKKNLNYLKEIPNENKFKLLSKKKVLIISNLINKKSFSSNRDIYTNDLQIILNKKKISNLKVLRNFTTDIYNNKSQKIVLPRLSFLSWELKMIFKIIKEFLKIKLFDKKKINYFTKKERYFLNKSTKLINLFGSLSTLRIIHQIETIINIVKPNIIYLPIEGHIWEKSLIKNIKLNYKMIDIVGIQFSSIIKNDDTIKTSYGNLYEPHKLICNKYLNYLIIKNKKLFKNSDLIYNNLSSKKNYRKSVKKFNKIKCLVVPELNIDEVNNFIQLVKKIKIKNKEIIFTFNLHPQTLKKDVISIKKQLKFIAKISVGNLNEEIKNNNVLIYRGSTACFEAAEKGLWLLYHNTGKFNINPIHELKLKKNNFSNDIEFFKIIDSLNSDTKLKFNKIFYPKKNQIFIYENK